MSLTLQQQVRLLLGEPIPEDGSETDTMFTDNEVEFFISKATGTDFVAEQAAYHGWLAKQAQFSNLVTVNEGNAARELTELHRNASRMVTHFTPYIGESVVHGKGRARVGQIRRPAPGSGPFNSSRRR